VLSHAAVHGTLAVSGAAIPQSGGAAQEAAEEWTRGRPSLHIAPPLALAALLSPGALLLRDSNRPARQGHTGEAPVDAASHAGGQDLLKRCVERVQSAGPPARTSGPGSDGSSRGLSPPGVSLRVSRGLGVGGDHWGGGTQGQGVHPFVCISVRA